MRKFSLLFVGIFISLILLIPINTKAITNIGKESDTRFTAANEAMHNSFNGSTSLQVGSDFIKYLKDGNKVWPSYCTDFTVVFVEGSEYTEGDHPDVGIQYIVGNGFKVDSNTTESYHFSTHSGCSAGSCSDVLNIRTNYPKNNQPWYVNYWLTQVAIWVYAERGRNQESSITALKNRLYSATDLTEDERIIKQLVDGANAAKADANNFTNVNPVLSVSDTNLTLNGDYYYSKEISATGTGDTFTISTSDNKYKVVDASKNEKTTFNKGDKFFIRIAKSDVTGSGDVTVTISTKGKYYARNFVKSGNQPMVSYKLEDSETKTNTLKLTITKNCDVTVKIIDADTKEPICGGSVVIQDANGKEVATMTFTEDKCTQTVSLPDGNYKAVQKEAPESYIKDEKAYEIDTKTKCPVDIEIPNTRLYKIRILKTVQGTETPIEGAKLKLEDSDGNTILEFVSSTEATIINNLHAGTYYLSEVEAPEGYALKTDKMEIQVNATNNDKLFLFPNDEIVVPITSFNSNLLYISIALCILGAGLVFYSKRKLSNVA